MSIIWSNIYYKGTASLWIINWILGVFFINKVSSSLMGLVDTSFFDVNLTFSGSRPFYQWIRTFQRHLWPYFWVWSYSCKLIQLFLFASIILSLELDVFHGNFRCKDVRFVLSPPLVTVFSKVTFCWVWFNFSKKYRNTVKELI